MALLTTRGMVKSKKIRQSAAKFPKFLFILEKSSQTILKRSTLLWQNNLQGYGKGKNFFINFVLYNFKII